MSEAATALSQRQTVIIHVNARGEITGTEPKTFEISKEHQQEVIWKIEPHHHAFTVEFEGEGPFYESKFDNVNSASGLVRRRVHANAEKVYKYKIRVGTSSHDPGGIVTR